MNRIDYSKFVESCSAQPRDTHAKNPVFGAPYGARCALDCGVDDPLYDCLKCGAICDFKAAENHATKCLEGRKP